ncbi:MAG: hypothetical protein U9P88_01850, partial [Patescibacteria group bacterium]|nr:hypothetical protein [Patescibacteria group bacterium]
INSIPDKSLPKILANNILKPVPEKDLKKIIEQGCYPISEPGEAIISLIGGSPSTDKDNKTINDFSGASDIIRKKLKDEFFEEAIDAMEQSQGKKDSLSKLADKIICFGPKEVKKTVDEILGKTEINEKQMRGFVNDVLEKSPETTLRKVSEHIDKCFSSNNKARKKILEKFSEYRYKGMIKEKGESPSLKIIMSYVPDLQLLDALELLTKEASKEDLKKCLDKTLDYSPQGLNKIAGDLSKNIPDKSIEDMMDKIFKSFPDNKTGNKDIDKFIRNKVSTFMADRLVGAYINKIAGFITQNNGWSKLLSRIKETCNCEEVNLGNIEEFTRGVLAGHPGLKQNGKYMIKITSNIPEGCSCIHGHCMSHHITGDGCSVCTGGDVCPYNEITKTYKIIKSYNNKNIRESFPKLIKSIQETDDLIKNKVEKGIYSSIADTRKNFSDCSMKGKEVGGKGTFVKLWRADDAVNYSWVNRYRHKLNFWCCYPKN